MSPITINLNINGSTVELQQPDAASVPEPVELPTIPGLLSGDQITIDEAELLDDNQAENEWHEKRRGRITCSRFGDIMKSGRGKAIWSDTALSYLRLLVAKRLGSYYHISGPSLAWGNENEAAAIEAYQQMRGVEVQSEAYQFFEYGDHAGGTPDGLVGTAGTIEVKCPHNPENHIRTLLSQDIDPRYQYQVAGHCLVTGREWCDFISFDPRIDGPQRIAVVRWVAAENEAILTELRERIELAAEWIEKAMQKVMA